MLRNHPLIYVDDSSKNIFENFSNIDNDNFKQFDLPLHENPKNFSDMKTFHNSVKMITQCQVRHEAWPHKI